MPTISAIISTFNREGFIADAIRSVLAQTHPPSEVIVVDDGSTDRTAEVVHSFSSRTPITYHWQPNQGPASALNIGVAMASGEWIAFLDSDDLWYPQKLAIQGEYIVAHPEVPFVYCAMEYTALDQDGQWKPVPKKWNSVLVPLIFRGLPNAHTPTVVLRKEVFRKEGGFDPSLPIGEGWEFFARIAMKYPIHFIPQRLAQQRYHPEQITRDPFLAVRHYHLFHTRMWELWKDDPDKQIVLLRDTFRIYSRFAKEFLCKGDFITARECYKWALSYDPWSWNNWRRLAISYLPGLREWYYSVKTKQKAF